MLRSTLWVSMVCVLVNSSAGASASEQMPGQQVPAELRTEGPHVIRYLLYLPQEYEQKSEWPLLLFLHGAGERGEDLELVTTHGPPRLIADGQHLPFIVVSPQCPKGRVWDPAQLVALLDAVCERCRVDADRVYVTGLSMGGFGTWNLAAHAPERFAAIVPICGGGDPDSVHRFAHIPVWAFHGARDTVVLPEQSQTMIDALKKLGATPKFTVYPDAGHDSWTATYNNPDLYEWLLRHTRNSRSGD